MTAQNVYAAVARTAARGMALYFSRPVRLFRPSKISGWQTLRVRARSDGSSLSPQYVLSLLKSQGFHVISHHFIPPLLVNSALGTILWSSYSLASSELQPRISNSVLASAIAGSIAGATQALAAAPAENVRILLEGGAEHAHWSAVWKSVFRASEDAVSATTGTSQSNLSRNQARHLREWVREIRDTAGHGWHGWRWTVAKDTCGFAAFFAIFEVSRQLAAESRVLVRQWPSERHEKAKQNTERIVYATTLVAGGAVAGLCYELVGRPWDNARHLVRLNQLTPESPPVTVMVLLARKLRDDGVRSFFRDPHALPVAPVYDNALKQRLYTVSRTLARVGPWGIGFLAWEAFGQQ
ncbi:hypothetical protein EXIGLDRAFT_709913 [Exidia glandulosa HHB12029]|uniref:Mitochondrial carrier n=1 Tax=Exidia glandulosa HHB12029 TaxID=1314781 RepID=A0A165IFI8_EXIGL|nr:hypothetical protein EXIGLDRAFT_709913 [Exidia glandulosa HHB12029]